MPIPSKFTNMITLGATVAGLALASPASAQQAKYCANGELAANSFYSNVISNGKTAVVEYFGQFQNMNGQKTLTARMVRIVQIGPFRVPQSLATPITLKPYQQTTTTLLKLQTDNPSGSGAPTPTEIGSKISFVCVLS